MKHFYSLALAFILLSSFSFAQNGTITGKVTGDEDKEPLIGVGIQADGNATVTDIDGNYKVSVKPGKQTLSFKYIGYTETVKTIDVKPGQSITLNVELKNASTQLEYVVVSASQYEKNIAEETVSMEVLDKDLLKNNNVTELGEALDKSVGVQVQDGQISIRGGSSYSYGVGSRTAVMMDNMSMMSADLGEAQLKFTPLENAEQVEVIKGASSVVYGSSALNGVVNVITAWPTSETPEAEFSVFQGVYDDPQRRETIWWDKDERPGFSGMFFNYQQKVNQFDVVAGANINYVNSFLEENNEFRFRGNFKTRYRHPKIKGMNFSLSGNVMKETSGRFFIAEDVDTNILRIGDGSFDRYVRTNIDPQFHYLTEKGSRHILRFRYLNVYRYGNGDDPDASSNGFTGDYQYQKNWKDKFFLTTGFPINFGFSKSNLYTGTRLNYSGALYVQGEYKSNKLSLVGGIRYEINAVDTLFETSSPVLRGGINYQVGKHTFLRTSLGQAYRLPSVGERFISAEFSVAKIFPNPTLLPEKGWSYELGVKQGIKISKWMGYLDVSAFWSEYTDFVEYQLGVYNPPGTDPDIEWLGLKPFNISNARIAGFEASLIGKGSIGPVEFRTLAGYTYTYPGNLTNDSTQKDVGVFLKNAIKGITERIEGDTATLSLLNYRVRHLVKGDIEFTFKKVSLGYTIYYGSFPEKIDQLFFIVIPSLDGYAEKHKEGDTVMGARLAYKVSDRLKLSFIVKNLTNHEYALRPGRVDPPRNFTLQLNFKI